MNGIVTQCGMAAQAAVGGLPAKDDIVRNNIFTSNVSGAQTVSANVYNSTAYKAVNGSTADYWAATPIPVIWQIDFGVEQAIYSLGIQTLQFSRWPIDYTIESSSDEAQWVVRHTVTGAGQAAVTRYDTLTDPAIARYWRINVTTSNSNSLRLVQLYWRS
jgi:hypothetical protein